MSLSRPWFLGLGAALSAVVCSNCHDSSGAQPAPALPVHSAAAASPSQSQHTPAPQAAFPTGAPSGSAPLTSTPTLVASADAGAPAASVGVGSTSASAAQAIPEGDALPALLDEQGKALIQTDQRPTLTSPSFQKRIALVARAILTGDVDPALTAFFPLVAYQQVKDVAKPERDYKFRLIANFKRDLLEYHRALGAAAAETKFDGITVPEKDAKWMAPGAEGNKVGYFRVLRSRLRFTLPTGRSREFELTSLISWRGEWYVVHLHGFK